jgi:hypothetical protein
MIAELGLKKMPFDKSIKVQDLYDSYDVGEITARLEYVKQFRGILLMSTAIRLTQRLVGPSFIGRSTLS